MITKTEVETALVKLGNVPHFRNLCFRHPDVRHRAGFQAIYFRLGRGEVFAEQHPPIELLRATPAGQKIPVDESPLITCKRCGGTTAVCELEPVGAIGADGFLVEDAE
jgi:hypothetical protein